MYREKIISDLQKMIDTNIPIIYINDFDTVTINSIIDEAIPDVPLEEWNPGTCLTEFGLFMSASEEKSNNIQDDLIRELRKIVQKDNVGLSFLVLREIQDYISAAPVKSLLASIAQRKLYDPDFGLVLLIVSSVVKIPEELLPYVSFLDIDYPDDDVIRNIIYKHIYVNEKDKASEDFKGKTSSEIDIIINKYIKEQPQKIKDEVESLLPNFRGMMPFDIDRMVDRAMNRNGTLGKDDYKMVLEHKKQIVKKSGVLELVDNNINIDEIGGLDNLKCYLRKKAFIRKYSSEASKEGVSMLKGIFMVGMPGCGKSLSAQATASLFGELLLKLDMGSLMGSLVGESEKNLRKAIKIAEAAAPCVLWIDEIEKAFSGTKSDDSPYLRRMFGSFLSWLQDKKSAVYVIATANNLATLPTEFKRKGRFDDMFYVDLPNREECKAIFNIKIKEKNKIIEESCKQNKKKYIKVSIDFKDKGKNNLLDYVSGEDENHPEIHFCGADIEYVVNEAFEIKYRKERMSEIIKQCEQENISLEEKQGSSSHSNEQELEQKKKELKYLKIQYEEDKKYLPNEIDEEVLLKIAKGIKCISMSSGDEDFDNMQKQSPLRNEKSPYLHATEKIINKYKDNE